MRGKNGRHESEILSTTLASQGVEQGAIMGNGHDHPVSVFVVTRRNFGQAV